MRNNRWINFVPYLIVILALFSLMNMNTGTATQNLTYNEFQKLVEEQKVTESAVTVGDNVIKIKGVYRFCAALGNRSRRADERAGSCRRQGQRHERIESVFRYDLIVDSVCDFRCDGVFPDFQDERRRQ